MKIKPNKKIQIATLLFSSTIAISTLALSKERRVENLKNEALSQESHLLAGCAFTCAATCDITKNHC